MKSAVKYELADKLAPHFENLVLQDRRTAFGVVLNAQLRINNKVTSLKEAFEEEDAFHIVNLTLQRVMQNRIIVVNVDIDGDDEVYIRRGEDVPF